MRNGIVFFGVKEPGLIGLKTLIDKKVQIDSVVTMGGIDNEPFEKIAAQIGAIFYIDPQLKNKSFQKKIIKNNVKTAVCISYPKIFPKSLLKLFKSNILNFHPAKLPDHRGCFPTIWPIINKDNEAKYTFHIMEEGIDTGPIIDSESIKINEKDTGWTLYKRLLGVLPKLIMRNVKNIKGGVNSSTPQSSHGVSYHNNKIPSNGKIDWEWPAEKIIRFVRALSNPIHLCAQASINNENFEIKKAIVSKIDKKIRLKAGTLIKKDKPFKISCSNGIIEILDFKQI